MSSTFEQRWIPAQNLWEDGHSISYIAKMYEISEKTFSNRVRKWRKKHSWFLSENKGTRYSSIGHAGVHHQMRNDDGIIDLMDSLDVISKRSSHSDALNNIGDWFYSEYHDSDIRVVKIIFGEVSLKEYAEDNDIDCIIDDFDKV